MTQKKSSLTASRCIAVLQVKKQFFSKKCIFWAKNDNFLKNSFYSKFISDQKYIICTFWKKKFFTKIMILYFSPNLTQSWQIVYMKARTCWLFHQKDGTRYLGITIFEYFLSHSINAKVEERYWAGQGWTMAEWRKQI